MCENSDNRERVEPNPFDVLPLPPQAIDAIQRALLDGIRLKRPGQVIELVDDTQRRPAGAVGLDPKRYR
jgi:hypothetical protein